jgi:hypothetical protein
MFGEHSTCVVINFNLPFADHSGPLKSEIKATDAGEQ